MSESKKAAAALAAATLAAVGAPRMPVRQRPRAQHAPPVNRPTMKTPPASRLRKRRRKAQRIARRKTRRARA